MGVYLKDTASTWVPGPINVADELYNQDLPDLSTDPDVIAGGGTSVDEVDQRVSAGVGANATNTAGMNSTQNGDRLVKTRPDGRIYVLTDSITETPHAVNKGYVDGIAREKADIQHTHISENISDATNTGGMANVDNGNRVVKTRADGRIYILTESVTHGAHAVNKGYVDQAIRDQPRVIPWSGQGDMPHIPVGSMVLDYSTGVLWGP